MEDAARLLGRHYLIEGEVVHGAHRGHALGFPTANLKTANELIPGFGVYAVLVRVKDRTCKGVASIGIRPTFDSGPVSIEVYLFDFHEDLYGKEMELLFVKRLRGEERFLGCRSPRSADPQGCTGCARGAEPVTTSESHLQGVTI